MLTRITGASHSIPDRLHRRKSIRPSLRRSIQASLRITSTPRSPPPHTASRLTLVSQKHAAGNLQAANSASAGLTLQEACQILNVSPPKGGQANVERVHEQFKRLFDMNDPKRGGSFYLQSKVLRARERLEMEVRTRQETEEREEEIRQGWRPKVYRD